MSIQDSNVVKTLQAGQPGTKGVSERFGDRLVTVRYRKDPKRRKRYKTIEVLIWSKTYLPPAQNVKEAKQ